MLQHLICQGQNSSSKAHCARYFSYYFVKLDLKFFMKYQLKTMSFRGNLQNSYGEEATSVQKPEILRQLLGISFHLDYSSIFIGANGRRNYFVFDPSKFKQDCLHCQLSPHSDGGLECFFLCSKSRDVQVFSPF